MPTQPTPSDVHVNRPLTGFSLAYMQKLTKFKADIVAPIMPVEKKSDSYFIMTKDFWFQNKMRKRGIGARAIQAGYGITQDSYLCDLWSLAKPIDDQTRANEDTPLNSDRGAMQFVTRQERMNRELQMKSALWGTGKWATDFTGNSSVSDYAGHTVNQWDDPDALPIDDVAAWIEIGEKLTGQTYNSLSIGKPVWKRLKSNPQILDRIAGGSTNASPAKVTTQLVAELFEIDELNIMDAVYNTAEEGSTFAGDYIFGKQAFFQYKDNTMGVETATACRTVTWKQYAGTDSGTRILKWRDEPIHSDQVEVESTFVHKIIAADLGLFVDALVAS